MCPPGRAWIHADDLSSCSTLQDEISPSVCLESARNNGDSWLVFCVHREDCKQVEYKAW